MMRTVPAGYGSMMDPYLTGGLSPREIRVAQLDYGLGWAWKNSMMRPEAAMSGLPVVEPGQL